jgi:dihydrofolate reductase
MSSAKAASDTVSPVPSAAVASDTVLQTPPVGAAPQAVLHAPSVKEALALAAERETGGEAFVIGGAQIYVAALPSVDRIYLTRVHAAVEGDTALPPDWLDAFTLVAEEPGTAGESPEHTFLIYERS